LLLDLVIYCIIYLSVLISTHQLIWIRWIFNLTFVNLIWLLNINSKYCLFILLKIWIHSVLWKIFTIDWFILIILLYKTCLFLLLTLIFFVLGFLLKNFRLKALWLLLRILATKSLWFLLRILVKKALCLILRILATQALLLLIKILSG
jgi:hypothetical protein